MGQDRPTPRGPQRRPGGRGRLAAVAASAILMTGALLTVVGPASADHGGAGPEGVSVSHWQGVVDWSQVAASGVSFAYIKATDGRSGTDPDFDANYPAAYYAGLIRGAYHFGRPDQSNGVRQARHFARNGGAWSADDQTLPGALELGWNPSNATCYGLTAAQMRDWIWDFHTEYKSWTTRDVVIHTTADWWNTCTGNWTGMAANSPLWVGHLGVSSPALPAGWSETTWTFWLFTSTGSVPGVPGGVDREGFNGSIDRLLALANNTP